MGKVLMNVAYLAALISAAIIKIAILCAIMCISILFILFKGVKKLLDSKGLPSILKTIGLISIILSVISLPLIILSLNTPSPLVVGVVGGIVGAISIVPLIAAYVFLSIAWKGLTQQPNDYKPLFLAPLLFIGNTVAEACIAASVAFSICKVDSLTSLSAVLGSLSMLEIHALALTIVSAIGVAIVIELAKRAKEYISDKITQPEEKLIESSNNYVKDTTPKPDSKIGETKEETARNEEVPPTCLTPLPTQHATHICTNIAIAGNLQVSFKCLLFLSSK